MNIKDPQTAKNIGKFISLILRHEPGAIDVTLDANGWLGVDELLAGLARKGKNITREDLDYLVANNNKSRYAYSEDGTMIRASQGHSVEVDLELVIATPPEKLFHGTTFSAVEKIQKEGIKKMSRHHVHLSANEATAIDVGSRRGKVAVFTVEALKMHGNGYEFYQSANGVWLTEFVPAKFISVGSIN